MTILKTALRRGIRDGRRRASTAGVASRSEREPVRVRTLARHHAIHVVARRKAGSRGLETNAHVALADGIFHRFCDEDLVSLGAVLAELARGVHFFAPHVGVSDAEHAAEPDPDAQNDVLLGLTAF